MRVQRWTRDVAYVDRALPTNLATLCTDHRYVPNSTFFYFTALNDVGARLCFTRVCDSIQGGGGVVSQHALQVTRPTARGSLRGLARSTPRGEVEGSGWGVSRPTPRGVPGSTPGGVPGPHGGGGCIPACTETDPPADGYCCRQYAFYWNAFLFFFKFEDMSSFCEAVDTAGLDSVTRFFGYVQWIP